MLQIQYEYTARSIGANLVKRVFDKLSSQRVINVRHRITYKIRLFALIR